MSLPLVEPPFDAGPEADSDTRDTGSDVSVHGILLAAGRSQRFGTRNKLLTDVDGEPIVRHAAETLAASQVDDVTVVLGYEAEQVADALAGLDVRTVRNPGYEAGQATSVRRGIESIRDRADAAVIALGDMPFVRPTTVDTLIAAYRAGHGDALAAAYQGERGNPVLFDASYFDALEDVEGDTGGREILLESGVLVETGDPGVWRDVDTPADLHTE